MVLLESYEVQPLHSLMLSILVLYLGFYLNRKISLLSEYYIPPAVTGGLICSLLVWLVYSLADLEVVFDLRIRDLLLLVFFSTIGLSAKFRTLAAGGIALAVLVAVAALLLVLQNGTGVLLAESSSAPIRAMALWAAASPSPAVTAPPSPGARRRKQPASPVPAPSASPLPPSG